MVCAGRSGYGHGGGGRGDDDGRRSVCRRRSWHTACARRNCGRTSTGGSGPLAFLAAGRRPVLIASRIRRPASASTPARLPRRFADTARAADATGSLGRGRALRRVSSRRRRVAGWRGRAETFAAASTPAPKRAIIAFFGRRGCRAGVCSGRRSVVHLRRGESLERRVVRRMRGQSKEPVRNRCVSCPTRMSGMTVVSVSTVRPVAERSDHVLQVKVGVAQHARRPAIRSHAHTKRAVSARGRLAQSKQDRRVDPRSHRPGRSTHPASPDRYRRRARVRLEAKLLRRRRRHPACARGGPGRGSRSRGEVGGERVVGEETRAEGDWGTRGGRRRVGWRQRMNVKPQRRA